MLVLGSDEKKNQLCNLKHHFNPAYSFLNQGFRFLFQWEACECEIETLKNLEKHQGCEHEAADQVFADVKRV